MDRTLEEQIYFIVWASNGITALELSEFLGVEKTMINSIFYKEKGLKYKKGDSYKWHTINNSKLINTVPYKFVVSKLIINSIFQIIFSTVRINKTKYLYSKYALPIFKNAYDLFEYLSVTLVELFIYIKTDSINKNEEATLKLLHEIKEKYKNELFIEMLPDDYDFYSPTKSDEIIYSGLFLKLLRLLIEFDIEELTYYSNLFVILLDDLITSFLNEERINSHNFNDKDFINSLLKEITNFKTNYSTCSLCCVKDFTFRMDFRISKANKNETWILCQKCLANYDYEHNMSLVNAIFNKRRIVK